MSTPAHIPTGNFPPHASVHTLDLEKTADRLIAQLPGHRRQSETLAREGGTSVVMMAMEAGDIVQEHSAKGPVSVHLLRGHAILTAGGKGVELRPGQLGFMEPGLMHDLRAEQQSVVLLTLSGAA